MHNLRVYTVVSFGVGTVIVVGHVHVHVGSVSFLSHSIKVGGFIYTCMSVYDNAVQLFPTTSLLVAVLVQ